MKDDKDKDENKMKQEECKFIIFIPFNFLGDENQNSENFINK